MFNVFRVFRENKELKMRVEALDQRLNSMAEANSLREDSKLKKCDLRLCRACAHAILWKDNWMNVPVLVGCAKSTDCADFVPKGRIGS